MTAANTATGEKHLELAVSNFGPIAEGTVELRPFTVFVGPSNTGKSYLATLIYALHRFFGNASERVGGGRDSGPFKIISTDNVTLSREDIDRLIAWVDEGRLHAETRRYSEDRLRVAEMPDNVSALVRRVINSIGYASGTLDDEIARCFGMGKTQNTIHYPGSDRAEFSIRGNASNESSDNGSFSHEITVTKQGTAIDFSLSDTMPVYGRSYVDVPWFLSKPEDVADTREQNARIYLGILAGMAFPYSAGHLYRKAYYLLTSRANLMHTHQTIVQSLIAGASRAATHPSTSPTFSGLLGDFLERIVSLGDRNNQREASDYPLALDLEQNVVGGEILIASNPVGYPEFLYRPYGWERDIPLANASSMVSELAPVVLYLRHVVQPGDTLIIEEPESHLHPTMQVELTRLLAAAVKAGIRIIITTHSEWILEELANLLLMSELPKDQRHGFEAADLTLSDAELGVWSFEPDAEVGGTMVKEIPLDKEMGKFPSDFGLVTVGLYNRFVRIANRIEMLKEE